MTEPVHWSQGLRGTPQDYIRIGRLLELANGPGPDLSGLDATPAEEDLLGEVLDELLAEDEALERWAEDGDPAIDSVLNAWLADPADMPYLDDLSNGDGGEIDLTALDFTEVIELAQQRRDQAMVRTRMTRMVGLDGWQRRGDMVGLMEAYLEAGTGGHRVELANAPGPDVSRQIELARATTGRYASICGAADAFGRCSAQFHAAECSHVAESAASRAGTPEDAAAWQGVLRRVVTERASGPGAIRRTRRDNFRAPRQLDQ
jgi:hypothetical protein